MAEQADSPLSVEQVLRDEAKAIHFLDKHAAEALDKKAGNDLSRALNDLGSCALCLSGGGIRSASFALGVIQALAVHPRQRGRSGADGRCSRASIISRPFRRWQRRLATERPFADIWSSLVRRLP